MALDLEPIEVTQALTSVAPDVDALTTNALEGTGVFDVLMRVTKLHLKEEYTAGRIIGKEYSEVYLGALGAVLAQSVAFLSAHDQSKRLTAEIGLIRQQTVTELVKTDDAIPAGLGFNDGIDVAGLSAKQLAQADKEIELATSKIAVSDKQIEQLTGQILQTAAEVVLIEQKQVTELAQTTLVKPDAAGLMTGMTITGIAGATVDKYVADTLLMNQKIVTEASQVSDILPAGLGVTLNTATGGTIGLNRDLVTEQIAKTVTEETLLDQKTVTELAQTADELPAGLGKNVYTTITGVIAKQKALFGKQADGFDRDAEQKLTKMLLDTWIVRQTTDGADSSLAGIAEADIKDVVNKARTGINLIAT
jgi:hypothetical protein